MNGAQGVVSTLLDAGVDTCFMNPGTSEMHLVAALDTAPKLRGVLALFEGVATGAADGYARITGKPAATLLHLGPGLGNGLANLHNARRARSPIVNLVGDHATHHQHLDAPLQSDIETLARNVSTFVRSAATTEGLCQDVLDAVDAAYGPPGSVATLIIPADVSWNESEVTAQRPGTVTPRGSGNRPDEGQIEAAGAALRGRGRTAILIGGRACHGKAFQLVAALAARSGARLLCETFPARLERGAGQPTVEQLSYLGDFAVAQMSGLQHLVLVDASSPVSFFAYPNKMSKLVPSDCVVHQVSAPGDDVLAALEALSFLVDSGEDTSPRAETGRPDLPTGALNAAGVAQAIGHLLPEGAIVSDEGNTGGIFVKGATAGAPQHDWLSLTGGAIGQGLPVALGAAIAAPDRPVLALQADGSALYTAQALWTMAREGLNVTTIILANRSYAVLNMELDQVGAGVPGPRARAMLDLTQPTMDFVSLANGFGVRASRAETAEEFSEQLGRALAEPGPNLIEAVIPSLL